MQVLNFAEQPFDSYFSGNTVQICPVGALTASQYRFRARPWDLATVETSCTTCAVQCRGAVQSSSNRLVRLLGVDSEPVNHGWLCDKGRYGIEWVHSERPRARAAWCATTASCARCRGRRRSTPRPTRSATAQRRCTAPARSRCSAARAAPTKTRTCGRVLAKGVIGTDNVDAQLGDGLPAEFVLGLPRAEIADSTARPRSCCSVRDLEEELPVLHLRVRRAAVELGVPLVDLAPVAHALVARTRPSSRAPLPGEPLARRRARRDHARARGDRPGPVVVVVGRGNRSPTSADAVVGAAADARAPCPTCGSSRRCAAATCTARSTPGSRPGSCPAASRSTPAASGSPTRGAAVPRERGLDADGHPRAAADGKIEVLVLLGADPVARLPRRRRSPRRGIDGGRARSSRSTAFLAGRRRSAPTCSCRCTLWGEKAGTVTNLEGRVQRVGRKVAPEGTAMDDWRIAAELALRLGADLDLATVDEVTDELARVAPALAGVDRRAAAARARRRRAPAARAPRRDRAPHAATLSILADDGSGTSWDPIKVEGEVASDVDAPAERRRRRATAVAAPHAPRPRSWEWDGARPERRGARTRRVRSAPRGRVGGSTTTGAW